MDSIVLGVDDLKEIKKLLFADTNDLTQLAQMVNADPREFYRGANFRDADLTNENLELFDLTHSDLTDCVLTVDQQQYVEERNFDNLWEAFTSSFFTINEDDVTASKNSIFNELISLPRRYGLTSKAEQWYLGALKDMSKANTKLGVAFIKLQLGTIAEKKEKYSEAVVWCNDALVDFERLDDKIYVALSSQQLGYIAENMNDSASAEKWYIKALTIFENLGEEMNAAISYDNLGSNALDATEAVNWYLKAVAIYEKQGNELNVAHTYQRIGILEGMMGEFDEAEKRQLKAIEILEKRNDKSSLLHSYDQLIHIAEERDDSVAAAKWRGQKKRIKTKANVE